MTKEDLEKEAYQYDVEHLRDNGTRWYHNVTVREAYLAGAEPREKRITELEAQIEKMKRCSMCKYGTRLGYCKIRQQGGGCENRDKWEAKEND